jgi:hypothetical protein
MLSDFDQLLIDTAPEFASGFGERIVFTPRSGIPRTIDAIVDRSPPMRVNAAGQVVTPKMTIQVVNDATAGISSAQLDAYGNDKATLALRIGGEAQEFGVYLPDQSSGSYSDAGMITLDLK